MLFGAVIDEESALQHRLEASDRNSRKETRRVADQSAITGVSSATAVNAFSL